MSGLLTFLLFGALFYFMMRFGCGAHAGHGGHGGHHRGPGGGGPAGTGQQTLAAGVEPSTIGLALKAAGQATSLFLVITYALCVAFDLLLPRYAMYHSWLGLLPGFHWLTWGSFFLGLIESYGYGWFIALIWVPLYNVFLLGGRSS